MVHRLLISNLVHNPFGTSLPGCHGFFSGWTNWSCDLIPLSYIGGLLTGGHNSKLTTPEGEEITSTEALNHVGIDVPFDLQAKEGLALVNDATVDSAVAAMVCYEANVLTLLSVVLPMMFCEAMQRKSKFTNLLTY